MLFKILVIVSIELLAVGFFCAGFILGRYSHKDKVTIKKIELEETLLDPISPEDQQLMKKLEEEAKGYVTEEDER